MAYNQQSISAGSSANLVVSPNPLTGIGTIDLVTSTLTDHGILIGGGADHALKATAALTDGQLLIGSTGNDPLPALLTAGTGVMITPAAGTITISATGSGGTVTSVTSANTDINVATTTTTPVLTLNPILTTITSISSPSDLTFTAAAGSEVVSASTLKLNQGQIINRTAVSSATYTALATDYIIGVTLLTAPTIITLPAVAGEPGQVYVVKDEDGAAATNTITVEGNGAENIDGANTFLINSAYESITLYNNGTQWSVI